MADNLGVKTIAELYKSSANKFGDIGAFATKDHKEKKWKKVSFKELYDMAVNVATGLIDLGIQARDHVALLADNRFEWILSDASIALTGAADVPRGTDVTDDDIVYILSHSDAKVVFVEHDKIYEKVKNNLNKLKNIKTIVMLDKNSKSKDSNLVHLYDLLEKGKSLRDAGDRKVEERVENIKSDDIITLIYTSGTTGAPKGVQLTNSNLISQVERSPVPLGQNDRLLSILPVWHIFERVFEYLAISYGACTYYTSIRHIGEDLRDVKPTFMGSAPRLWESIYTKILENVKKSSGVKRGLFDAAYFFSKGFHSSLAFLTGSALDMVDRNPVISFITGLLYIIQMILFAVPYFLLDFIVLKKIRAATGGQFKGTISGGGALPGHIDEFFNFIGVPVLEGYGMTETSPVISVRTFQQLIIGTVGPIFQDTDVRIIDLQTGKIIFTTEDGGPMTRGVKGEIHVNGPQVMKGYYKNEEATSKVLKDGWMNTGDIGMITFNDCLKIMGRSKDTIVLISGENAEPVPIENTLQGSPLIDQCMVVGQDQKFLGAFIIPSIEGFEKRGIKGELADLATNDEVEETIKAEIKTLISSEAGFKSFEKIHGFRLIPKAFEVGDEMTNLFKLKRHIITEKYQKELDSIFKD